MSIYITVQRTQIYLDAESVAALRRLARETGKTRSQLIREAVDRLQRGGHDAGGVVEALRRSAGAWRRRQSGEAIVDRLRSGRLARIRR